MKVIDHVTEKINISVRRACKILWIARSSYNYIPTKDPNEQLLRERMISLASDYGRYGYRRITAMLRREGIIVNHKRVERWRVEYNQIRPHSRSRGYRTPCS